MLMFRWVLMRSIGRTAAALCLVSIAAFPVAASAGEVSSLGAVDAVGIAVDTYIYAAPNADTPYTEVWLDVSEQPWVFSIPDMGDRYYIMPMLDGWSEVFSVASSRTTGSKAQTYAITGPGWSGALSQGITGIKSPTGMVWILGRIYSTGTPEDYKAVRALQDKFSIVPVSGVSAVAKRIVL